MKDSPPEDLDGPLFDRFRSGDPDAMRRIVEVFHVRLVGFARLFTGRRELAEEIAQETFLALYHQRSQVRSADAVGSWLFTTAKRKALRETGRKHHKLEQSIDEMTHPPDAPEDGHQMDGLLAIDQRRAIAQALDGLGETERSLIELRYFAELPLKEISDALSMPMGSVGTKLRRTLDKVREQLEKKGLGLGDLVK